MKALTCKQPEASLVTLGVVSVLTRSWNTDYRGPLAIHAGASDKAIRHGFTIGDWRTYRADAVSAPHPEPHRMYARAPGATRPESSVPLPIGAIVATCRLVDVVPILDVVQTENHPGRWLEVGTSRSYLSLWRPGAAIAERLDDQLPYGDFTPGRWAWLLEDVKPTTERCPACWGRQTWDENGIESGKRTTCDPAADVCPRCSAFAKYEVRCSLRCSTCDGKGTCDPIPARGRQGLWRWTP